MSEEKLNKYINYIWSYIIYNVTTKRQKKKKSLFDGLSKYLQKNNLGWTRGRGIREEDNRRRNKDSDDETRQDKNTTKCKTIPRNPWTIQGHQDQETRQGKHSQDRRDPKSPTRDEDTETERELVQFKRQTRVLLPARHKNVSMTNLGRSLPVFADQLWTGRVDRAQLLDGIRINRLKNATRRLDQSGWTWMVPWWFPLS